MSALSHPPLAEPRISRDYVRGFANGVIEGKAEAAQQMAEATMPRSLGLRAALTVSTALLACCIVWMLTHMALNHWWAR
jgi:hypothetical protein